MAGSLPIRPAGACSRPSNPPFARVSKGQSCSAYTLRRTCGAPRSRFGPAGAAAVTSDVGGGSGGGSGSGVRGGGSGGSGGHDGPAGAGDSPLPWGAALAVAVLDWADSWPTAAAHRAQGNRPASPRAGRNAAALGAMLGAVGALAAAASAAAAVAETASSSSHRPGGSAGSAGGSAGGSAPPPPAAPEGGSGGAAMVAASAPAVQDLVQEQVQQQTQEPGAQQPQQQLQYQQQQQEGVTLMPAGTANEQAAEPEGQAPAGSATPASPKRIALFIEPSPFTYTSGYKTRFRATIAELVAEGCEVLVVTPGRGAAGLLPGGEAQPSEFAGARVVEAGSFPCPGYSTVPLSLGLSPRIFNAVKGFQPDIIHVTSPGALPAAAWLYSRLLRVPLVASYHTHVPAYLPRLGLGWLASGMWAAIRTIHRAAHLTIAVSPATAANLVGAGACDRRAVKVWPKAVDCDAFNPVHACPKMRQRLEGGGDAPTGRPDSHRDGPLLLYVGRVSPEKNLALLRPLLEQLPGARLAVVGDGPAMADIQEQFAGTPTTFLGQLSGRELSAAYASADLFVMPSESETLGNVVGEAMASGLPVVAAAAGGVPSVIGRPGTTGILFPPGDAAAAAAAVRRLVADPAARRRMGQAARAEMQRCSWRAATRELLRAHYPAALAAWRQEEAGTAATPWSVAALRTA